MNITHGFRARIINNIHTNSVGVIIENTNMTLVEAVLIVGLVVGAGVGYYMSPSGDGARAYLKVKQMNMKPPFTTEHHPHITIILPDRESAFTRTGL